MTCNIGKTTEYQVYNTLKKIGNLKAINNKECIPSTKSLITQSNINTLCKNYKYIDITHPNDGSSLKTRPTTADIVLYKTINKTGGLGISVKYNNLSMKHHRPHMLHKQMKMTQALSERFSTEYNEIENTWMQKLKQYSMYNEVPYKVKLDLMYDINLITINWLNNHPRFFSNYIKFIIDDNTPIIIKVNPDSSIEILKKKKYQIKEPKAYMNYDRGIIHILPSSSYPNTPIIQMRLHTCERYIKNRISLKYDVKVTGLFDK